MRLGSLANLHALPTALHLERIQHALDAGSVPLSALKLEPVLEHLRVSSLPDRHPALFENLSATTGRGPFGIAPGAGLEALIDGALSSGRRPSGPELDVLYQQLAPYTRSVPTMTQRQSLPNVPFIELNLVPQVMGAVHEALAPKSVELFWSVDSARPTFPGHTFIRVGDTIFEDFTRKQIPLNGQNASAVLSTFLWPGSMLLGFGFGASAAEIKLLAQRFREAPLPKFDFLCRDGAQNCNGFATGVMEQALPRLGVKHDADPLHLFSSLLWQNPKLAFVTLGSVSPEPLLSGSGFLAGPLESAIFAPAGQHPAAHRLLKILERKPVGYTFPGVDPFAG